MSPARPQPTRLQQWLASPVFPDLAICVGLVLSIFAVYAQVGQFAFFNFDDDLYVFGNPSVRAGLTPASIKWSLTAVTASNWQPVTLLSHMLDVQLFGLQSGMHHLMNVLLHALSAVLLYLLLQRATRSRAPSAFVAFIFALHPLHVESVAWIAERKDVLSTFFFFLSLYAYVRYAERPGTRWYLTMFGLFCLGLMSKPMMVTFPFVLLLFDFWPLRRVQLPKILWEKLPLVVLSAIVSAVTYHVQLQTGVVADTIPLTGRIGQALLSYIIYIRQTFWPAGLAVFYPYPRLILASRVAAASVLLLGVTALAIYAWRKRPYLAVGWFWYLGTLVPVIGVVKVGYQAHADRYTYIPMVGLSIMLAWGAVDLMESWPRTKSAIAAAAVATCLACLVLTWTQAGYWQDSEKLYVHAIDVTADNWLAEGNLGSYLMKIPERRPDALEHLQAALRIRPVYPEAENNLGLCMARLELCGAAIPHFEAALRADPLMAAASNNLGLCLTRIGNYGAAIEAIENALRLKPDYANAHFNLAVTFSKMPGRELEAIAQYQTGLRLSDPMGNDSAEAHRNLGVLFMNLGRTKEAISQFEASQQIQPDPETSATINRLRSGGK